MLIKVIISHDVDHITAWEHSKDLIIPKFVARMFVEHGLGYISRCEVKSRLLSLLENRWNHLEELMAFDRNQGIPSTFFIGASNGSHLSYGQDVAGAWIKKIKERGFEVGVHGIAYDEGEAMVRERNSFRRMSGLNAFGMRMHYLRKAPNTIYRLAEIGYTFDSSETATTNPYKIGRMWEFPLHIMDGDILCNGARWQQRDLGEACHVTRQRLDEALVAGIRYFTLLFHDRYFSDEFKTWKDWYIWSIDLIKRSGFEFASYDRAMKDLVQSSEE